MKKACVSSVLIVEVLLAVGMIAEAQQAKKVYRIGFLAGTRELNISTSNRAVLLKALRTLGYIDGKNLVVENRNAEGKVDRFPALVAELVQIKVDVLVATNPTAIRAAKNATKTIPIVMIISEDPVEGGIVDSLAHPGGNITGVSILARDLSGKRLELLKEIVPGISRVGILIPGDSSITASDLKGYEAAALALKLQLHSLAVDSTNPDLPVVFDRARSSRVNAVIALRNSLLNSNAKLIADLAIKKQLPLMFERSAYVESGGLVSYANSDGESFQRAAALVDKILKGTRPADLPVEQPTKFELVINLKTAKQIGLGIPQWTLMKADRVIR